MIVNLTNMCARFSTGCPLDLEEIKNNEFYLMLSSKKFKKRFSALICKYKETNLTFLIFKTGTVCLVGGRSRQQLKNATYDLVYLLRTIGLYSANVNEYRLTNICVATNFNKRIDLIKLAENKPLQVSYETEIFVNAKYKQNGYVFTITHRGNAFCTGFKNKESIKEQMKILYKDLKPYFKENK